MTVMVTGASGLLGHAVVSALLARDEVRATVRRPAAAEPLRALGAKVAVLDPRHADDLAEVLSRCHTLVHLIGGVRQPDAEELFWANHGSVELALDAARQASTTRFVLVSVPAADPETTHPFLRAKGMAEAAVTTAGIEHAIVRSTHAYGLGGSWFTATVQGATTTPPFVCGPGTQPLAPVFAPDVAAVVAAIDDHPGPLEGTWGIEGPDVVSADELVAILRADDTSPTHADGQPAAAALDQTAGDTGRRRDGLVLRDAEPGRPPRRGGGLRGQDDAAAGGAARDAHRRRRPRRRSRRQLGFALMGNLVDLTIDDQVAVLRLQRPPANAIDLGLAEELQAAIREADGRSEVGALVMTGGPTIFAAGADIKAMATWGPEEVRPSVDALGEACDLLEAIDTISIAAINGYALGGGFELALGCDLRYAATDATLGQPEIGLGVIPGAGGTQRLVRLVGPGRTRQIVYSGRLIPAEEALRLGIVERVLEPGEVLDAAVEDARRFANGPRVALAAAKTAIGAAISSPGAPGIQAEREAFLALFGTPDQREGMAAFLEKRKPRFGR